MITPVRDVVCVTPASESASTMVACHPPSRMESNDLVNTGLVWISLPPTVSVSVHACLDCGVDGGR